MKNAENLRKRICQFYEKNSENGNKATLQHFLAEGVARSTIYDAIQRVKSGIGAIRRVGSGRIALKMPREKVRRLARQFDQKDGKSQKAAAREYEIDQSYVCKLLKGLKIKCRTKKTIPDRTLEQAAAAKTKCRIITEKYKNFQWILDDESYFTLSHSSLSGNSFFYSSDVTKSSSKVRYVRKAKYEKKLLVWVAISSKGISNIFIVPSGQAVNQHIYKEECLKRRLIPFIQKYHQEDEFIFWPDLASSHYAETVCDFMIESKINFVEKYENPANLPECRPIEQFWAILKEKVYKRNWKAKNLDQLEKRIKFQATQVDRSLLADLFTSMVRTIKDVGRNGVIEQR
jgi:transposase